MSVFKNITDKVTDTAKTAATKSGELVQIKKLNINIGSEEDRIEKICTEIGKEVYEMYASGQEVEETIKEKCDAIKAINDNIQVMKNKILELKDLKACTSCGTELQADYPFCFNCGSKQ